MHTPHLGACHHARLPAEVGCPSLTRDKLLSCRCEPRTPLRAALACRTGLAPVWLALKLLEDTTEHSWLPVQLHTELGRLAPAMACAAEGSPVMQV